MLTDTLKNRVPATDDQREPTFAGLVPNRVEGAGTSESQTRADFSRPLFATITVEDWGRAIHRGRLFDNEVARQIRERAAAVERERAVRRGPAWRWLTRSPGRAWREWLGAIWGLALVLGGCAAGLGRRCSAALWLLGLAVALVLALVPLLLVYAPAERKRRKGVR